MYRYDLAYPCSRYRLVVGNHVILLGYVVWPPRYNDYWDYWANKEANKRLIQGMSEASHG